MPDPKTSTIRYRKTGKSKPGRDLQGVDPGSLSKSLMLKRSAREERKSLRLNEDGGGFVGAKRRQLALLCTRAGTMI